MTDESEHISYCPHREIKPVEQCFWCMTERGYDPFNNVPRLIRDGKMPEWAYPLLKKPATD